MSMYLNLVRLTPTAFEVLKANPALLEGVFFDEDAAVLAALHIEDGDVSGFDHRVATQALEAVADAMGDADVGDEDEDEPEDDGDEEEDDDDDDDAEDDDAEDDDAVLTNLGVDGALDFEAGYGPAFFLTPKAVKKAKHCTVVALDEEVEALVLAAAKRGDYLVGVIS